VEREKKEKKGVYEEVKRTSSIPKSKIHWLAVDHHICRVVIEHGRDVFSGEGICGVRNQTIGEKKVRPKQAFKLNKKKKLTGKFYR